MRTSLWLLLCFVVACDTRPLQPTVSSLYQRISQGAEHTCGIAIGGAAYCWGYNAQGELGNGTTESSSVPVPVAGGLNFASVSAGLSENTCGVTTSGAAYCWGSNGFGQAGNGTTTAAMTPAAVSGGLTFMQVSAGTQYACGVATTGAGYCWGRNYTAIMGNGTMNTGSTTPAPVSGGLVFTAISTGSFEACGITVSGAAYCWGGNATGSLGDSGRSTFATTPVHVSGGLKFAELSAGLLHVCGITTDAAAYCWGGNYRGELGNGDPSGPEQCAGEPCSTTPLAVSGGLRFTTLSAKVNISCGVTRESAAYCWGASAGGELGNGTNDQTANGTPVAVSGDLKFAMVNGTCGLTLSGAAYCWGSNGAGELGNGTMSGPEQCWVGPCSTMPVAVLTSRQ